MKKTLVTAYSEYEISSKFVYLIQSYIPIVNNNVWKKIGNNNEDIIVRCKL